MRRVIVCGSLAFDRIMTLPAKISDYILADQLEKLNVSFTVDSLRQEYGGTGGNCAYPLGLLDVNPILISALGHDGASYKQHLSHSGVDVSGIIDSDQFTAVGHVMTDQVDHQIWMFYPGALSDITAVSLHSIVSPDDFVLLMPSNPQAFVKHLHEVVQIGADFLFDPAFFIPLLSQDDLILGCKYASIVIGNEYEIQLLKEKVDLSQSKTVIETLGSKGAQVYRSHQKDHVETANVTAVDPTGAGDAFRAGLIAGLMQNTDIIKAVKMGMISSAYCVETLGTQNYHYTPDQFWKRYEENYGKS